MYTLKYKEFKKCEKNESDISHWMVRKSEKSPKTRKL